MKKDAQITVNLEEAVHIAFVKLAQAEGLSISALCRRLIVTELRKRDLMPLSTLEHLVVGGRSLPAGQ